MATPGKKSREWDRDSRLPVPPPPPISCDCQFHIYDEPAEFPPRADAPYPPIATATCAAAQKMHKVIEFGRGVIVYSAIYGSNHRLLLHALEGLEDRGRYCDISIVDDGVSDKELERMHAAGVLGARFNFVRFLQLDQREAEVTRSMARLSELGWHARLHVHGDDLLNNSDLALGPGLAITHCLNARRDRFVCLPLCQAFFIWCVRMNCCRDPQGDSLLREVPRR